MENQLQNDIKRSMESFDKSIDDLFKNKESKIKEILKQVEYNSKYEEELLDENDIS